MYNIKLGKNETDIEEREDLQRIIENSNNSIEGDKVKEFIKDIKKSPYDIRTCSICDPEYIVEISDQESLEDKISRILKGDRVGMDLRKGTYDIKGKVVGKDKTGRAIVTYESLNPEVEDIIYKTQLRNTTLADITEANEDVKAERIEDEKAKKEKAKVEKEAEKASKEAEKAKKEKPPEGGSDKPTE